jgi:hypothetical protein
LLDVLLTALGAGDFFLVVFKEAHDQGEFVLAVKAEILVGRHDSTLLKIGISECVTKAEYG